MVRALSIFVLALAVACENPMSVQGARALTPEPDWGWRALYDSVEACTGLEGDYDRIHWFAVEHLYTGDGGAAGYWQPSHRIYLEVDGERSTDVPRVYWRRVARHEMIHELLQDGSHASPAFRRCDRLR